MDLVGKQVMHRVFGKGCVSSLDSGRIVVRFSEGAGEKAFCYPDAFAQHLTLEAAEDREQILSLLQQRRRQRTEHYIRQGQEIQEEAERQAEEKRLARRSARLTAAKPRTPRKSAEAKEAGAARE